MLFVDWRRQDADLARAARRQREPALRRADVGHRPEHRTKPADFDPIKSLFLYLTASFGGLTTVVGALFAGIFLAVMPEVVKHLPLDNMQNYLIGLGAISLATNPHGFGGTLSMGRQAITDAIRRRRPAERPVAPALAEAGAR